MMILPYPKKNKLLIGQIYEPFRQAETDQQLVGIEGEKIGLMAATGKPVKYRGNQGYLAILGRMHNELGWEIVKQEGKAILEMKRCQSYLSLESDGRIELAGSPHHSIHDLAREFRIHQNEISEISKTFGVSWLGVGCHPLSMNKEIEDVMVERKKQIILFLEREKRKTGSDFGLAWYKKTAAVHINIDYASEEDFGRKNRILFRLAPVLSAMFANSPFSKGKFTGYMNYRRHLTIRTGIPRFTLSKKLFKSRFSYKDWIEHAMDIETPFLKKEGRWIHPHIPFRTYLKEGYLGHQATLEDWDMHMKSVWTDVRGRKTIEIRFIDSLPPHMMPCAAAVIKGLMYDEDVLAALEAMTGTWRFEEVQELQETSARHALKTDLRGQKLLHLAKELLQMASESLKRKKVLDAFGNDESEHLAPIQEFVFIKGKSPAEWLVEEWMGPWNRNFYPVLEWYRY